MQRRACGRFLRRQRDRAGHDPRGDLQRRRHLRAGARARLRTRVGVPRARVRDPRPGRLRRAADRRRLVHRRARRARRRPRALQHVPSPRDAGVPRRAGQRLALPLPVPRVDVQEHGRAGRRAVPQGRLRRRGPACAREGDGAAACAARRDLQRARSSPRSTRPLRRSTTTSAASSFYLDFYSSQSASGRRGSRPAALRIVEANWKIGAENFCRRHLPHAPHARERRGDRPVPRAEGKQAQGGRAVLRRGGRRHDLQAPDRRLPREPALRRLPRRDGRPDGAAVERRAAGAGRSGRASCPRQPRSTRT